MKKELQEKLFKKYPKIFKQKDLSMKETCMCWGIDVGDGWFNLIDIVCNKIQFEIDHNFYSQIEFTQVKEKFGTLRIYYTTKLNNKKSKIFFEKIMDLCIKFSNYLFSKKLIDFEHIIAFRKFQYDNGKIDGIIDLAEDLSSHICEICGETGKIMIKNNFWLKTLCIKHANKLGYKSKNVKK